MKKIIGLFLASVFISSIFVGIIPKVMAFQKDVSDFDRIWYDEGGIGFNKVGTGTLVFAVTYTNATQDNPNFRMIDYCNITFESNPFYFRIFFSEELETDLEGIPIEPVDGYAYLRKSFVQDYMPDDLKSLASKNLQYSTISFQGVDWFRIYIPNFNREYIWKQYDASDTGKWFTWGSWDTIRFKSRAMKIEINDDANGMKLDITHDIINDGQMVSFNKTWLSNKGIINPYFENWKPLIFHENNTHYWIEPEHFSFIDVHEAVTGIKDGGVFWNYDSSDIGNGSVIESQGSVQNDGLFDLPDTYFWQQFWDSDKNLSCISRIDLYINDADGNAFTELYLQNWDGTETHRIRNYTIPASASDVWRGWDFKDYPCNTEQQFRLYLIKTNNEGTFKVNRWWQYPGPSTKYNNGDCSWGDRYDACFRIYGWESQFDTNRTVGSVSETNVINETTSNYFKNNTGVQIIRVPLSTDVNAITGCWNVTSNDEATSVGSISELTNNTYYLDTVNNWCYIGTTNITSGQSLHWEVNGSYGATFNINYPEYKEIGEDIFLQGVIEDANDNGIDGVMANTCIKKNGETLVGPIKWNCTGGNYYCVLSTNTLTPSVYDITIEFYDTTTAVNFSDGQQIYLSYEPVSGVYYSTHVYFSLYDNQTGLGIPMDEYKIRVSTSLPLSDNDILHNNVFYTYIGDVIYYDVLDYFDNVIYPASGSYANATVSSNSEFFSIPIDIYDFSVKNMNHSIVWFNLTNGSRTYNIWLYPYEPYYFKVIAGEYNISKRYYDPETGAFEKQNMENITIDDDTYYWIRGYDLSDIVIEITNVNSTIMNQLVNIGVTITNDGADIINQTINLNYWLNNVESNITGQISNVHSSVNNSLTSINSQVNNVWQTINNSNTDILKQTNNVWQTINNTNTSIRNQINNMWQDINNSDASIHTQMNSVWQTINNSNADIIKQSNNMWQSINNTNATIHTQLNTIISNVDNAEASIHTQMNSVWQTINNSNTDILNQNNQIWQSVNNSNSTIHTQLNTINQQVSNSESNITTQISSVHQSINNSNTDILNQGNNIWQSINNSDSTSIINQINNMWQSVNNTNTSILNQVNGVWQSVNNSGADILTQVNAMWQTVNNSNGTIHTQLNTILQDIYNSNSTIHNQLNTIISNVDNAEASIHTQVNSLWQTVNNSNSTIHTQLNMVDQYIDNANTTIHEQLNFVHQEIHDFETNITTQVNWANISIINMNSSVSNQLNVIQTDISNTNSTIHTQITAVSNQLTNMHSLINNSFNQIEVDITNTESTITNQLNSVSINITNSNTTIHNQLNAIITQISNEETNIIDQVNLIWNAVNNTNSSIYTQINGINSEVINFWSDVNNSFTAVTTNIYWANVTIHNLINETNETLYLHITDILNNVSSGGLSAIDSCLQLINDINSQNINLSWINENVTDVLDNISAINVTFNGNFTDVLLNLSYILENVSLVNVSLGNLVNVSIGNLTDVIINVWGAINETNNRSKVVFSFYNTNEGLGLDRETLKVFINDTRLVGDVYECINGTKINLKIKDYYNFTLYQHNYTVSSPFTFVDIGLTFHSYLFGNKNDDYYMISFLKDGASRWYERGVVPYGEREYLLPTGNYTMRIYDKNYDEIYNQSISMVNSRVYVIHGTNLSLIINGQSIITDTLVEIQDDFDYALTPDVIYYSLNPPMIFSAFDIEGLSLGQGVWKVCPAVNIIATTRNQSSYSNNINSIAMVPSNGTTSNGTITILDDTVFFEGNYSTSWVNITYTDNSTEMYNITYIPTKLDVLGQNLTINASENIKIKRYTKFNQMKKFKWDVYNWSYGYDNRPGYHEAGIQVRNSLDGTMYDVYVFAGFSDKTSPDTSSVRIYDDDNDNQLLKQGENYKVTDSGIEFYIQSVPPHTTRSFTICYYREQFDNYDYGEEHISITSYDEFIEYNNEVYHHFQIPFVNDKNSIFRGGIYVTLDFDMPTTIDRQSIIILDSNNDATIDSSQYLYGSGFIRLGTDAVGDVNPGMNRNYDVYFRYTETPEDDDTSYDLDTTVGKVGGLPITLFLIGYIVSMILIGFGAYKYIFDKQKVDRWKILIALGIFMLFMLMVLQVKGL